MIFWSFNQDLISTILNFNSIILRFANKIKCSWRTPCPFYSNYLLEQKSCLKFKSIIVLILVIYKSKVCLKREPNYNIKTKQMQSSATKPILQSFFIRNMGPTLEVLSFFSHSSVKHLLNSLSKKSQQFYQKNKQGVFYNTYPSVLSANMVEKEKITNLLPLSVVRVIHLRDQIFLVGYANGIIEMRDLITKPQLTGKEPDEPILSFDPLQQYDRDQLGCMTDFCCKQKSESQILMCFETGTIIKLDLKANTNEKQDLPQVKARNYTPSTPRCIQFMENLESDEFIMLSEVDLYQSIQAVVEIQDANDLVKNRQLSRLGPIYGIQNLGRLGGFHAELQDSGNQLGTQGVEEDPEPSTLIASLSREKIPPNAGGNLDMTSVKANSKSFVSVTRWYGLDNQRNKTDYLQLADNFKFYCLRVD